jgi:hypothetical protein
LLKILLAVIAFHRVGGGLTLYGSHKISAADFNCNLAIPYAIQNIKG